MSGHHPLSELTNDFTPERRRRIQAMKDKLLADMPLHELRRARALTQQDLAETLKVISLQWPSWSSERICMSPVFVLMLKPWADG